MKFKQKFCAVVKADAYGLGAKKICQEIDDLVDYFAVSSEQEFKLVNTVVGKPILILDPIYKNITKLAKMNCEFCVSNTEQFFIIHRLSKRNPHVKYKIYLALNTGMNRFGFNDKKEIFNILTILQKTQNILVLGIFSHFYAGTDKKFAKTQSSQVVKLKKDLKEKFNIEELVFHISNTSGFENYRGLDMVRIGIGMYLFNNNSCFSLESKIIEIRKIKRGENVGYGNNYFAPLDMKIAVVLIGYADGIMRSISGRGFVLLKGCFCRIISVCMDSIIIDITNVNACLQDDVILIGKSQGKEIFVCDFALWCDTIEYEIMTRISSRVKRLYIGGKTDANNNRKVPSKKTSSC